MRLDIFDTKGFVIRLEPVESDRRLVSLIAHRSVLSNPDVPRPFDKREKQSRIGIFCVVTDSLFPGWHRFEAFLIPLSPVGWFSNAKATSTARNAFHWKRR